MGATSGKANTCARSVRSADAFLPPRAFGEFDLEDGSQDTRGEMAFVSETHEADGGAELMPVTVAQPGDASPMEEDVVGVARFEERALAFLFSDSDRCGQADAGESAEHGFPQQAMMSIPAHKGNTSRQCSDRMVNVEM
mmetsp:Transcript_26324/g.74908  ORF Transcript_26324/g.74908 Transcript_26324/m.74908 type:complete len:139 (-) Transcript_26324:72-488(-)